MARPVIPTPAPELRQRAWAALIIGAFSLLAIAFIGNISRAVYVLAMSFLFGVVALWLGVTAISRSRRGGTGRPRGAAAGVVFGVLGLGLSGLMLIAFGALGPQLTQYAHCLDSANTTSARNACETQFKNSVKGLLFVVFRPGVHVDDVTLLLFVLVGHCFRWRVLAEDEPVGRARRHRGGHPDLQDRHQPSLQPARAGDR
jgi:hypothetical protein